MKRDIVDKKVHCAQLNYFNLKVIKVIDNAQLMFFRGKII